MGLACSSTHGFDQQSATIECKINYIRAVSDGEVMCTARVIHPGRRTLVVEADVMQGDKLVAKAQGTFAVLRGELLAVIGEAVGRVAQAYPVDSTVSRGSLETAIFGACFVVGLDRQTYHPERTRDQSVAAIMAIMRGYVLKQPAPRG